MIDQGGITDDTKIERPAADPAAGKSDVPSNETPLDSVGHSRGGQLSTVDEVRVNSGATLYHAGSVLRCRSAGALRRLASGHDSDGRDARPSMEPFRPTLRAYSAPHILHSALYPPQDRGRKRRGKIPVETSNPSGDSRSTRDPSLARGSAGRRTQELSDGEEAGAPCKHRQGGYLHKHQGFEQEEVSCPPVVTFRVLGGLGELPRRRKCDTAPGRKKTANRVRDAQLIQEPAASYSRAGRRDRLGGSFGLAEEAHNSPVVELSQTVGAEGGKAPAHAMEPLDEGSNVPIDSPPGGLTAEIPAWCSTRRKSRPRGDKKLKAREAGTMPGESPRSKTVTKSRTKAKHVLATRSKSSTRAALRLDGKSSTVPAHNMRSTAYLPYSLERPVSRERTQAFLYTSN